MKISRSRLVDTDVTRWYHCISRCVRRAMLLSEDGSPGRQDWSDNRLRELDRIFAISVGGFSIMDNHIHFLLRIDVEEASKWSAMEIARRWMTLYPPRGSDRKPLKETDEFLKLKADNAVWIATTRKRLSSLGWFMKCLKEPLARLASGRIADVSEIRNGSVAATNFSDGLERDLWLVPNRRSSQAGSIARRNARGIHAGSVSDAGGLHESFGKRRQSVNDSRSGEYLYEAWQ